MQQGAPPKREFIQNAAGFEAVSSCSASCRRFVMAAAWGCSVLASARSQVSGLAQRAGGFQPWQVSRAFSFAFRVPLASFSNLSQQLNTSELRAGRDPQVITSLGEAGDSKTLTQ